MTTACAHCGTVRHEGDRFCSRCGSEVTTAGSMPIRADVYPGFWRRASAGAIDAFVDVLIVLVLVSWRLAPPANPVLQAILLAFNSTIARLVVTASYEALFSASRLRATPGKWLLGMAVVDENGDRISIGQAYGRAFGKYVSGLLFGVGYFMIAVTRRRQGLHDKLAGTRVVYRDVTDQIVMTDPLAPRPNIFGAGLAFVCTVGIVGGWAVAQLLLGASVKQVAKNQWAMSVGSGHPKAPPALVAGKARIQSHDLWLEAAQAMKAVAVYNEANNALPDSLAETDYHKTHTDVQRVTFNRDRLEVSAFAHGGPLDGRALQLHVQRDADTDEFVIACDSPDLPDRLLPSVCRQGE
ncbi:RDD family protein [Salinisphaera sp. Q1T1-3]|uniref:RDD family protein n=1 Tax=Salinisphaera sp. Q1T1-3 TaxID=2321229 RepID=UPI000E744AE7|nr:RDD family protein [Salinisphaera sp. Q1T1-3]RJS91977.1 RDD family protein [Salinisphaera sp. Q1T1-3]